MSSQNHLNLASTKAFNRLALGLVIGLVVLRRLSFVFW